jgi:hypothetical protein
MGSLLIVTHAQTSLSDVWTGSATTDIPSRLAIQAIRPISIQQEQGNVPKTTRKKADAYRGSSTAPLARLNREIWNAATVKMASSEELCERGKI